MYKLMEKCIIENVVIFQNNRKGRSTSEENKTFTTFSLNTSS
jgi:hypothetical protein